MIGKEGKSDRWVGAVGGWRWDAMEQEAVARRERQKQRERERERETVVIRVCVDGTQSKIRG